MRARTLVLCAFSCLTVGCESSMQPLPDWPAITREAKPWTRFWWMGSALDEAGLTAFMEQLEDVGIGGVEITPIYGVAGAEGRFVEYLTEDWLRLLEAALREGERLDLGVDMATGTGWPFGGPWVEEKDACMHIARRMWTLRGGERIEEPIRLAEEPFVRAVGNQIYELHGGILGDPTERRLGTMERPAEIAGRRVPPVEGLKRPVSANENLQALALEQVRYPGQLPLLAVIAYGSNGEVEDLTGRVDDAGTLGWTAPEGEWQVYAAFLGRHGKLVERAAPGGEGDVIDHFDQGAVERYLDRFDRAFNGHDLSPLRAFFNDSYEVDDARGQADWTPDLFESFEQRRGYDLRRHLPALFGEADEEENLRVRTDYRETVSDLLLERFTITWREWANRRGALIRNQAHGSPAQILDLYAASDIPETEGRELVRFKWASSAAHLTGKRLVSAEAATWLNEHFLSTPADIRAALEAYWLGGVNHVVYHGTNYSPPGESWPGWLFYAAIHLSPSNPVWTDLGALHAYAARVQSFLQNGTPDADALLYVPIHDLYASTEGPLLVHVDGGMKTFRGTVFQRAAEALDTLGIPFDLVSDRLLRDVAVRPDGLLAAGGTTYRTLVVPSSRVLPVETLDRIRALAAEGGTVLVFGDAAPSVPGLGDLARRQARFDSLRNVLGLAGEALDAPRTVDVGRGRLLHGSEIERLVETAGLVRETMGNEGLRFVRRRHARGSTYFVVNRSGRLFDGWIPLAVAARGAALFEPMRAIRGVATVLETAPGTSAVRAYLPAGESLIIQTFDRPVRGEPFPLFRPAGPARSIAGPWTLRFDTGGPELPATVTLADPTDWTEIDGAAYAAFSGTASYRAGFSRPDQSADAWSLDLGAVAASARVRLNGREIATVIGPDWAIVIPDSLFASENELEVAVSNLMANRIADLDRRGVPWKKFYNVNFPARRAENRNARGLFDASAWPALPSGLRGPVTLRPLRFEREPPPP